MVCADVRGAACGRWGWAWGDPLPVALCRAPGASPQLCQLLLVDEEMLSSHLRSFDQYGPIVQMGKPRFSEGTPLWTQWLISLGS